MVGDSTMVSVYQLRKDFISFSRRKIPIKVQDKKFPLDY